MEHPQLDALLARFYRFPPSDAAREVEASSQVSAP